MNARDIEAPVTRPRLGVRLWLARLALYWEAVWPALWPAAAIALLFVILSLFDVLPALPAWLHAAALAGLAIALVGALWRVPARVAWPHIAAGRRRLERDSGLSDRPLTAIDDGLAAGTGDALSEALWRAHRTRMLRALGRLRVSPPRPGLAVLDPFALRCALLLLFIVAAVDARGDAFVRMARALQPDFTGAAAADVATIELWVTPPPHTGIAPRFLDRTSEPGGTLTIPVSSRVLAQIHGGAAPVLVAGTSEVAFESLDGTTARVEVVVEDAGRLAVRDDGQDLVGWDLVVTPDRAPGVVFAQPPATSRRSHLRIDYIADDDYGVESLAAEIRRPDGPADQRIDLELALPGLHLGTAEGTSYHDLTPHPWAGLPVDIVLVATDAIGQTGRTEAFRMVLPERIFQHPVARALVELRKELTRDPGADSRHAVAETLRDLASRPLHYQEDKVVFLALVTAAARLDLDRDGGAVPPVQDLLWDTALHIEEGKLSLAERELLALQRELLDALARDAGDAEIQDLIDQLERALDNYLEALARDLAEGAREMQDPVPFDPDAQMLQFDDLRDLLDQAREMARSGARDAARELLSRLNDILQNMRPMLGQMQQGQGERNQMLRDLSDLLGRQRDLLDRTFRQWQQELQSGTPTPGDAMREGELSQEALRRALGELMRRFGEQFGSIPDALGEAERAMREAENALGRQMPGRAVGPQGEALDLLREGGRAMAQGQQGFAPGQAGFGPGFDRDPLGRPLPGFGRANTENVDIPDAADLKRAREIVDELRRRAGERSRPEIELDYIERLLRRF